MTAPEVPSRRAPLTPVEATEQQDWSWSFSPPVPPALHRRLAHLCGEVASAQGLLDALAGWSVWDRDTEYELVVTRQDWCISAATTELAAMGFRLRGLTPAIGGRGERAEAEA